MGVVPLEPLRCRSCGKTKMKEKGKRCPDCEKKNPVVVHTHCIKCKRSLRKLPPHRSRKYCLKCRRSSGVRDNRRAPCPGCGKIIKLCYAPVHAVKCDSGVDPETIKDVIIATEKAPAILKKNDWTLNKPIEQLNKEYYDRNN